VIIVNKKGRLGNSLFQYTFGRIIHEKTGQKLFTHLKNSNIPEIKDIEGIIKPNYLLLKDYAECEGNIINIDEIIQYNCGFILDGFFQHKSYYESRRNEIKSWLFDIKKTELDTAAVHLRFDDYTQINWHLPESYYNECLKLSSSKKLLIFTDDPHHNYVKKLISLGGELSNLSDIDDLKKMASCNEIIMSRSSYSWWAAFLSNANKVYFPRPKNGWWSIKDTPHKDLLLNYPEYQIINV